jgi:DNA primase
MLDLPALKQQAPDLLILAGQLTTLRKVAASNGGEWAGACPWCGGVDRFRIQPHHSEPRWLCRSCSDGKWKDVIDFIERRDNLPFKEAVKELFGPNVHVAPERIAELQAERQRADVERARIETEQQAAKRAELHTSGAWMEYYHHPDTYTHWAARGLSSQWVDYFQFGYNPGREFRSGNDTFTSPSLTIPYFKTTVTDGVPSWECIGLIHRLTLDNPPGGKYRPHAAGLGRPLFRCDLYDPGIRGEVLLVEGEIKAAVTWARLQDYVYECKPASFLGRLTVVGCTSKNISAAQLAELAGASQIWICLDPDATKEAEAAARALGADRCRIIDLPGKIDDLLNDESIDIESIYHLMRSARRIK